MNKQELTAVALLFLLLLGWGFMNRNNLASKPPARQPAPAASVSTQTLAAAVGAVTNRAAAVAPRESLSRPAESLAPERTVVLSNALTHIVVSSHGGAIKEAELPGFRAMVDKASGPVRLDFDGEPALALHGIPGLDTDGDFALTPTADGLGVVARARGANGVELTRTLRLTGDYQVAVEDDFQNVGSAPVELPASAVALGPMHMNATESLTPGIVYLGLDTLASQGGSRVVHWGKRVSELFGIHGGIGCVHPSMENVPGSVSHNLETQSDWVAAKNKYFVQILAPAEPAKDCTLRVVRDTTASAMRLTSVSADMRFGAQHLGPGEQVTRKAAYYVGPKEFDLLKSLGRYKESIMQFGWWDWFQWLCGLLLHTLNTIHRFIPNYGVAIILVTVIVRVLFWPITAKSTQSMKKMQKIQPLVAAIREKHKSSPQKMNQEIMALYREHRVNPMSGCLPMVVQIPVFIALYTVLRSAIELRFAPFLWIKDLSEPEHLFAGMLPMGLSLNVLPLLMTATTVFQQKLTPTSADPAQKNMMMIMPIMFLFLFYNMASALVLYWTVSQLLAIVQLVRSQRSAGNTPPAATPAPALAKSKARR